MKASRLWGLLGGLLVGSAVGLAAWHAHGLVDSLGPEDHAIFGRGIDQQILSGIGLLFLALFADRRPGSRLGLAAGVAMALGAILFCGSVYARALLGPDAPGLAPAGGMLQIAAWLLVGAHAATARPATRQ